MKTKEIKKKIEDLQKQLKELELKENQIEIKFKKKTFKICKWTKQIKDFPIPKGFRIAEHYEFIELIDSKKFKVLECPNEYFTNNYSKLNQERGFEFSRVYMFGSSSVDSGDEYLRGSGGNGRVVVVK